MPHKHKKDRTAASTRSRAKRRERGYSQLCVSNVHNDIREELKAFVRAYMEATPEQRLTVAKLFERT